jgi:TolA-binding protein
MKHSPLKLLLLAAVAGATLAGPIVAEAQPSDRAETREERQENRKKAHQERQQERQQNQQQRQQAQQQRQGARQQTQQQRQVTRQDTRQARQQQLTRQQQQQARQRQQQARQRTAPPPAANRARPPRQLTPQRQQARRNAQQQIRRSFNRSTWQNRWRRQHSTRNWWRNDRHFRGWNGVRVGFYFAPGYGYYNVPRSYYNVRYYEGGYLPSLFWRYRVIDPFFYGLPSAPPGTAWVYVNNAILLVDLYDGYIIEVVPDVWYW